MARPIDFSSLTRAERIVLGAGLALFANGFVPWWYRARTSEGVVSYNAGLTGLGTVAVLAGAAAVLLVGMRAAIWPEPAPRLDGAAYAALGGIALASLIMQLVRSEAWWLGPWVAIAGAVVLLLAGTWRRRERRSGWT